MRIYKPLLPSLRQLCLIDHAIFSKKPYNSHFLTHLKTNAGRNHSGHITVRHHEGGHKKNYRIIDLFNRVFNVPFFVKSIEYDPYRSGFISLVFYSNGLINYRISIYKTFIGDSLMSYHNIPESIRNGDACLLKYVAPGSLVCNLELYPSKGSQISRSAGTTALLLKKENSDAFLKLRSKQIIILSTFCSASLGSISNRNHRYINLGKAGRSRYLGIRPTVRGVAMNPVDHPHGGGEGKKSKRSWPRSPWGKTFKKRSITYLMK